MKKNGREYEYVTKWGSVVVDENEVGIRGFHFGLLNKVIPRSEFPVNEEVVKILADAIDRLTVEYSIKRKELKKLKAGVV